MKKFFIFTGILLLLAGIYEYWYKDYAQYQRFLKIFKESQHVKEAEEVKEQIQTNVFREDHLKHTMRTLYKYCDTEAIKFDFYTAVFNADKKSCFVIYKVDLLDLECDAYNSEYIGIVFYMAKLLKEDNVWQIEKIESDGYIYDGFITLGEIPREIIFPENEAITRFYTLSKEEKRNYISKIPVENFLKVLWSFYQQKLGYNFGDKHY